MALKYETPSLDGVPDAARPFYVQRDGKYVLDVEGAAPISALNEAHARVVEFRETNLKLLKALGAEDVSGAIQRAERLSALKDVDPEEYKRLKSESEALSKRGITKADDFDVRLKSALDAVVNPLRQELDGVKRDRAEVQRRADEATLRNAIGEKALRAGAKPSAVEFLVSKARETFRVVDGELVAIEGKLSSASQRAGQPIEPDEWLAGTVKEFDFAFEPSRGAGASGGVKGASAQGQPTKFRLPSGQEVKMDGIAPLA